MKQLLLLLLVQLLQRCAAQLQCPAITSINPPSGVISPMFNYIIEGSNLDLVMSVSASSGTLSFSTISPTRIRFNFVNSFTSGNNVITLLPMDANCPAISNTIQVYLNSPLVNQVSSTNGQPGTIIRFTGCFPPGCGDNSSSYMITIGGVAVERINPSVTQEQPFNHFTVRLVEIPAAIPAASVTIVTQYGTMFTIQSHSIDYQLAGTINAVTPSSGQQGTEVTITGTMLIGLGALGLTLNQVRLGANEAVIISSTQSQIVVQAAKGPVGSGNVQLNSTQMVNNVELNGPYTFLAGIWTQNEDGVITEITPPAAQPGSTVFLCGTDLLGGGSSIASVTVIDTAAPTFSSTLISDPIPGAPSECIDVIVPSASGMTDGAISIRADTNALISTPTGTSFQYSTINTPVPAQGQVFTEVVITGTQLLSGYMGTAPTVYLSGVPATVINSAPHEIIVSAGTAQPSVLNMPGDVTISVTVSGLTFNLSLSNAWTYLPAGQVTTVSPSFGQFGTQVTLTGTSLLGYGSSITSVQFLSTGSTPVAAVASSVSDTEVVVAAPAPATVGYTGPATIELTANNGAKVTATDAFEYRTAGTISAIQPPTGQNGTYVTITGDNLFGYGSNVSEVLLGQVSATVIHSSTTNTSIYVRVGAFDTATNTPVSVTITSDTSAQVISSGNIWTYIPQGQITGISPMVGQIGSLITITGSNLLGGGATIDMIVLDGVPTSDILAQSNTQIRVRLGDESGRDASLYPGQVFIQANTGAVVFGGSFQQNAPGEITSFSPAQGRTGTQIIITGSDLTGFGNSIISVEIAGVNAMPGPYMTTQNDGQLIIRASSGTTGANGPIRITTDTQAVIVSSNIFTYLQDGSITSLSPITGAEGTGILIRGLDLQVGSSDISSVTIGGNEATRIVTYSPTEVAIIAGPPPQGTLSGLLVRVIATDMSYVEGGSFTYQDLVVSVVGLNQGQHGTRITLMVPFVVGDVMRVLIDDKEATILTRSTTSVTIEVPRPGQVGQFSTDIVVENEDHTIARLPNGFMYLNEGHITTVTPDVGQSGTNIAIRGVDLLGGGSSVDSVSIGGITAQVTSSSNSLVEIRLTANPTSSSFPLVADIIITADTGAIVQRVEAFSYTEPGRITSITPSTGQRGTRVAIQGTNLIQGTLQVSSVMLAGVMAIVTGTPSDSVINVDASSSLPQSGVVTITLSSGAQVVSTDMFQYTTAGVIASVSPSSGTVGTRVTITGQNLLGGGSSVSMVMLDGTAATIVSGNDASISVTAQESSSVTNLPGSVEIISNTGTLVTIASSWTYQPLGSITSISPTTGQQGVMVNITGNSLLGSSGSTISSVTLAGITANVISAEDSLVVVSAGHSFTAMSGAVELTVDTGPVLTSDPSIPSQAWSYYAASLTSISPSLGTNGTRVILTGVNLPGQPDTPFTVSSVTLAGTNAYDIQVLSPSSIRVRAGYNTPMAGDVRVESTSGAYLVLDNGWTYEQPGVITSVEPSSAAPGETVIITGERIVPLDNMTVKVTFGQTEAFSATVLNTSAVSVRPAPYQGLDSVNTSLPVLIEASNGATVYSSSGLFTYNSTGMVTNITPTAGGTGSQVTITGTGLVSGSGDPIVYLAGVQATLVSSSETMITVNAGTGSDITGSLVIESTNGQQTGQSGAAWTYLPAVDSSMVQPQSGRNGTRVQLNLTAIPSQYSLESALLGAIEASIISNDSNVVLVEAGISAASSLTDITLQFADDVTLTVASAWTYQTPVTITSTPSDLTGYFNTLVTITGSGFQAGAAATPVSSVTLAGISTTIVSQSDTQLELRINETMDSSTGSITGPVIIISEDGATYNSGGLLFTYVSVLVSNVDPPLGQNRTRVTLQGLGLLAGGTSVASLSLAGVSASLVSHSDTEIVVIAEALNTSSTGDIIYEVDTGAQVILPNRWSYTTPGLITSVDPTAGNRGTIVTITGSDMLGGGTSASSVYLNEVAVDEVTLSSSSLIQVRAGQGPMATAGEVRIVANTGAEVTSEGNLFTYTQPGVVSAINPGSGQVGTVVSIFGLRFESGESIKSVTLAGVEANIQFASSSLVRVAAQRPQMLGSFSGTVLITSNRGTITESSSAQTFTYTQEGLITSVSPSRGQRGSILTLKGVNLLGGSASLTSATIAGTPASISSQNDTSVVLIAEANTDSMAMDVLGDIVLTANSGAEVTRVNSWTYIEYGRIISITPGAGQYGTRVTIDGVRLTGGGVSVASVFIGPHEALEVISSSATRVVFRAGDPINSTITAGAISLISNSGANISTDTMWSYQTASRIISVAPENGTANSEVNVTGVDLLGGGSGIAQVTVAGIPVKEITFVSNSLVTFVTGFNNEGIEISGSIRIEADSGALTVLENGWTYVSECPVGQFGNNTNSCMPCDDQCVQCRGPSEFDCFDCRNFRIMNNTHQQCVSECPTFSTTDKLCVASCQSDQYSQTDLNDVMVCLDCHSQCDPNLGCSGPNNTISHCTECRNVSNNGFCVAMCPEGTFNNGGTCAPCHAQCDQASGCTGPLRSECNQCASFTLPAVSTTDARDQCVESCPDRYYVDEKNFCRPCDQECLGNCSGPLPTDCTSCAHASIEYSNGTRLCIPDCNPDSVMRTMFQEPSNGACRTCSPLCSLTAGCTGPAPSECRACRNFTGNNTNEADFVPLFDGQCVSSCPDDEDSKTFYYADLRTGVCNRCHANCENDCTGPSLSDCTTPQVEPFIAGAGTIVVVVLISLILFILLIAVLVLLFWKTYRKNGAKLTHTITSPDIELQTNYYITKDNPLTSISGDNEVPDIIDLSTEVTGNEEHSIDETYTDMEVGVASRTPSPVPQPVENDEYIKMGPVPITLQSSSPPGSGNTSTSEPVSPPVTADTSTSEPVPPPAADKPPPIPPKPTSAAGAEENVGKPPPADPPSPEKLSASQENLYDDTADSLPTSPTKTDVSPPGDAPAVSLSQENLYDDTEGPLVAAVIASTSPVKTEKPPVDIPVVSLSQENLYDDTEGPLVAAVIASTSPTKTEKPPVDTPAVSLSQENLYDDTEGPVVAAALAKITSSPSINLNEPLPPVPQLSQVEDLYEDTEIFSPTKKEESQPLAQLYEDTDEATLAAMKFLKKTPKPPAPVPRQPPQVPPKSNKPPPLPPIPKRMSNTPLPELPPSGGQRSEAMVIQNVYSGGTDAADEDNSESLYEPIPASKPIPYIGSQPKPKPKKRIFGKKK